jgi:hypothetical protein
MMLPSIIFYTVKFRPSPVELMYEVTTEGKLRAGIACCSGTLTNQGLKLSKWIDSSFLERFDRIIKEDC